MVGAAVAVIGAGVKTPAGCTLESLWSSLCAATPTAHRFRDDRLPPDAPIAVCTVDDFDPLGYMTPIEARRLDRTHHLAIGAAQDAMTMVTTGLPRPDRRAVVVGVGFGATPTYEAQYAALLEKGLRGLSPLVIPTVMPNAAAAHLSLRFDAKGPCPTISTACASGTSAIGEGVELLRRGAADMVLAGG